MDAITRLNAALAGHYTVQREIGSGGMATVYLAEDLRHHRPVAIKVLREDLSATVGAARFLREIEIAAQLQHPNILPLLDSGDADGLLYFVMPFVEGESLRRRLQREQELPVGEAVRLLAEVVDALSYSHAKGVVHRDIKPDNVMLSGRHALVADFGVARAVSEATHGNTLTTGGIALGTPAYMSPEQAVADPHVDHRTDLYAVGVMAYELLSGRTPFSGAQPQQVLAAHLTETPDPIAKRRPSLAPELSQAVMRCLEKRPADRWQSADDLLAVLEPLATTSGASAPTQVRLVAAKRKSVWLGVGAVLGLTAVVVFAEQRFVGERVSGPSLSIGQASPLTSDAGLQITPAISPDGKLVAYAAGNSQHMRIFIRPVGGGRTIPLTDDTAAVETEPRWSPPDGSRLLFRVGGGVSIAPALGGSPRAVIPRGVATAVTTATWSPDGREIAFVRGDSLLVSPADGQGLRLVATGSALTACRWSQAGIIACVSGNPAAQVPGPSFANLAPSAIVTVPAAGGVFKTVADSNLNQSPEWSARGGTLYFISNRDGPPDLYELAIDRGGNARGGPVRVTTNSHAHSMSISADGKRLAYSIFTGRVNVWSIPIPTRSMGVVSAETATPVTSGEQIVESVSPTRDGKWLLYDSDRDGHPNIYRIRIGGGEPEQLTHERFNVFAPDLSPDGRLLAYHSFRTGARNVEVKPLDGGPVEMVTKPPEEESFPTWSPDGTRLLSFDQRPPSKVSVVRRLAPGKWSVPVTVAAGLGPKWSPDGREILFVSIDSTSIVIAPADSGAPRRVYDFATGGVKPRSPRWSADGKTIYFKSFDASGRAAIYSIPANGGANPRLLVRFPDLAHPSSRNDFGVDAKRFYFVIADRQSNIWIADAGR
jgi:serine/threonine-protein kinase